MDTPEGILKGFDRFDELGSVTVEKDREKLRQKLVKDFLKVKDQGDTAFITTPTHKEADYLTAHLREALKERGKIRGQEQIVPTRQKIDWTTAQKRDVRNYEPGMVLEFHKDIGGERKSVNGIRQTTGGFKRGEKCVVVEYETVVPKLGRKSGLVLLREDGTNAHLPFEHADRFQVYSTGTKSFAIGDQLRITKNGRPKVAGQTIGTQFNNGDVYPIEGFTKEGDFRLPNGKLLPRNYGHIAYGYASTPQGSQGSTVDWNLVDWNSETLRAVDRPGAYVPSSRFRKGITYFVDNKKAVRAAIQRRDENKTAYELVKEHQGHVEARPQKFTLSDHLARNRVARYFNQGVSALRQMGRNVARSWRERLGPQYG
jgi:hypothetical protein